MLKEIETLQGRQRNPYYDKHVMEYFRLGSVDSVMQSHLQDGISSAELHRQLNKREIVKVWGRRNDLSLVTSFFIEFVNTCGSNLFYKNGNPLPLQTFYKKYLPPSFKELVSLSWLQGVYAHILSQGKKRAELKRIGTALIITHPEDDKGVLVCDELTRPDATVGKWPNAITFPMGYSPPNKRSGILRILQQEVFAEQASQGLLGNNSAISNTMLDNGALTNLAQIDIAHVRVSVCRLTCPPEFADLTSFNSNKVGNYRFVDIDEIAFRNPNSHKIRAGVVDMANIHREDLINRSANENMLLQSSLNLALARLPFTPQRRVI